MNISLAPYCNEPGNWTLNKQVFLERQELQFAGAQNQSLAAGVSGGFSERLS
jgi:hypothetical protein